MALSGTLKVRWHDWLGRTPCAIPEYVNKADKVEGMMLGLAIGDALGNTSESKNPSDRQLRYGRIEGYLPNRYADGRKVGLPSDDTQLAYRTLLHLIENDRLDPHLLGNRLAHGRIFGLGKSTREWLGRFKTGVRWESAGSLSAGNGALMRIAPILIPHLAAPNSDLWADTLLAAHLTHDDELSNVSCVAMVDALWRAIGTRGEVPARWWLDPWLQVCDALSSGVSYAPRAGHPPDFEGTIAEMLRSYVSSALDQRLPVDEACETWHSGAYLLETVPTVLYILERYGNDPREAILQAVNHTRDNDTVAAIVGAAVGALHGAAALPPEWVDGLSGRIAEDDDNRVFDLLVRAGRVFRYGCSERTIERAKSYREPTADPGEVRVPPGLLRGQLWLKIVGFLQQNWAVIARLAPGAHAVRVWFVSDGFTAFDFIDFPNLRDAESALRRNGFGHYHESEGEFLESDLPRFRSRALRWSPRRIYSSGQYWT